MPSSTPTTTQAAPTPTPTITAAEPKQRTRPRTPEVVTVGDIKAKIIPVEMTDNELTPPPDPQILGWWGRPAGARHGATLLIGHTVHTGGGALDHLDEVTPGTEVSVSGVKYTVVSNEDISKEDLPARAEDLFNQSGPHKLVIVTCTDYDVATGHHLSNTVLTATPVVP